MNTSQFLDKQIMEFSSMQTGDLSDLLKPKDDHHSGATSGSGGGWKEEEILPSYDFQPIRAAGSPSLSSPRSDRDGARTWGQVESKTAASSSRDSRNYGPSEILESSRVSQEKAKETCDITLVAEIDRAVKKHADNLFHALEGLSSRLTQLESRTRHIESSVDSLKMIIGDNVGSTDGMLRQLGNILREVQTEVQLLRDKKEITDAQQLPKLQASTSDQQYADAATPDYQQQLPPQQKPFQQSSQPSVPPQRPPTSPVFPAPQLPNAPPTPRPIPASGQFPITLPQHQFASVPSLPQQQSFPPPGQPQEAKSQQYQAPAQQPPPPPQYHLPPPMQYPQTPQPPQGQSPLVQNPEGSSPYMTPHQTYPPVARQHSLPSQPPSGPLRPQQYYGSGSHMYEPASRASSGAVPYSSGYGAPPRPPFSDSYDYSDAPHYKPSQFMTSLASPSGGGSNHPRLPTAKILPQAMPTGPSSGGSTGNRLPVEDVVDKVATMGFSRDQVRATVRKLTENGQSVDLNVVLDKLMNGEDRRGW